MKKLIILLCAVSTALLFGCGNSKISVNEEANNTSSSNDETVTLKIWGSEEDAELLSIICSSFEAKNSDTKFNFVIEAQPESSCKDVLLNDVNNAADVFTFADDQFSVFCASGVLKPIPESDEVAKRNSSGSVEASTMSNTLYAYPLTADNGYFLFYNGEFLSEDDVETFDKLLAKAEALGKKVTFDWSSGWYTYSFFGNTGLTLGLNDDGITNYCNWNDIENPIKGIDVANAMMNIASSSAFLNGGDSVFTDGLADGSVIAGISGVWLSNALEEAWGDNLKATKLPTYTCNDSQVQLSSYAGYKLVGVNSYSSNLEWAHKFANYMTSEECQSLRFEMRKQGPSNINAASNPSVLENVGIQALIAQSEFSSLQRVGNTYWSPMADFGERMATLNPDEKDLQLVLDELVSAITALN